MQIETEKARVQFEIDALERLQVEKFSATDNLQQQNNNETTENNQRFPFLQRRAHFKARVKRLEKELIDLKNERQDIDKNRGRLTMIMQTTQIVYTNLLIENDRVTRFNGDLVTSSAINGAAMQYQKADLAIIISNALDKATDDIANAKYTVITDEKRKLEIKKVNMDNFMILTSFLQ